MSGTTQTSYMIAEVSGRAGIVYKQIAFPPPPPTAHASSALAIYILNIAKVYDNNSRGAPTHSISFSRLPGTWNPETNVLFPFMKYVYFRKSSCFSVFAEFMSF